MIKCLIICFTFCFSQNYFKDWIHLDVKDNVIDTSLIKLYNENDISYFNFDNQNQIINNLVGIEFSPDKYFKKIYLKSFKNNIHQTSEDFLNVRYQTNYMKVGGKIEYQYNSKIQFISDFSLNSTNKKKDYSFLINVDSFKKININFMYSKDHHPYLLDLTYDEFNFKNQSSINKDLFSIGISYKIPSYLFSFKINDYNINIKSKEQSDILFIKTNYNKEFITTFSYLYKQHQLNFEHFFNKIELDGKLDKFEDNIYTINKFENYNNKINIAYHYNNSIFGLSYKSLLYDIVGRLRASAISEDLSVQFGAPIINNFNNFKLNQFLIYYNKEYKNYLFDIQLINENYDIYYQTITPPFNPIIPIINYDRMNIKRRIAINLGLKRTYVYNQLLIKIFIKQHIPVKNYYYKNNNDSNTISNNYYKEYGG